MYEKIDVFNIISAYIFHILLLCITGIYLYIFMYKLKLESESLKH